MTKLLTGMAVGAAMLMGVGAAQAEPVKLTAQQMDGVTAGALAIAKAKASALAFGRFTFTKASADTVADSFFGVSASEAKSVSVAAF
jgi:hypothetical protein